MEISKLFNSPFIGAIIADANQGKSNFIYHIIKKLNSRYDFNLYTYGLKSDVKGANKIYSLDELERIRDSVIFLDEFYDLFDLEDRHNKSIAERTLRLLFHNNNIIILSGLPENYKKFISAKVSITFYKQCTFEDFVNGSSSKKKILKYHGSKRGSSILHMGKDECLIYDGNHYYDYKIPYLKERDSKRNNVSILVEKSVVKKVDKYGI